MYKSQLRILFILLQRFAVESESLLTGANGYYVGRECNYQLTYCRMAQNFDFNHACCLEPLFDVFKISLVIVHPSYCYQVSIRLMNCFFRYHHSYQNHYFVRILDLETNHNLEYLPLERPYQLSHPSPNFNLDQNLAYLLNHPFDSRKGKDYQPTSSSQALLQ